MLAVAFANARRSESAIPRPLLFNQEALRHVLAMTVRHAFSSELAPTDPEPDMYFVLT